MPDEMPSSVFTYLCVVASALIGAVIFGFEKVAPFLVVTLFTLPSIVGYEICDKYFIRLPAAKQIAFFVPYLLIAGICVINLSSPSSDADTVYPLMRGLLVTLTAQTSIAYLCLNLYRRYVQRAK